MTQWDYPTAFSAWGLDEEEAIARVLRSGRLTMGAEVEAFEAEFAAWHGMKHGIMVNSGSSANLVAVAALFAKVDKPLQRAVPADDEYEWNDTGSGRSKPFGSGGPRMSDRAIVPALAWSTTYAPLVQHGLWLVLADCDETWNASLALRASGRYGVRLVVGCSILGNPGYMIEWKRFADSIGAYFIEDNCESLGAMRSGHLCGTLGIMNTFSFFYSHQLSAIEGGMILTNDDECMKLCRMLRAHGWSRDVERPSRFEDEYDFRLMGYNVRPLEMHAAVARAQLKKVDELNDHRRANYYYFVDATRGLPIAHQVEASGTLGEESLRAPFGLPFLCESNEKRSALVAELRTDGIDCRLPTGGSFRLHKFGKPWYSQQTPYADGIHERGIFLGNAPWLISDKIERAVKIMRRVL